LRVQNLFLTPASKFLCESNGRAEHRSVSSQTGNVSLSLCLNQCRFPFVRNRLSLRNVKALRGSMHCLGSVLILAAGSLLCGQFQAVTGTGRLTVWEKTSWLKEVKFSKEKPKDRERAQPLFFKLIILVTACLAETYFRLWQWDLPPTATPRGERNGPTCLHICSIRSAEIRECSSLPLKKKQHKQ